MNVRRNRDGLKRWLNFTLDELKKGVKWSKKKQSETLHTYSLLLKNNVYLKDASDLLVQHGTRKEKVIAAKVGRYIGDGGNIDDALKNDLSLTAYQSLKAGVYADDVIKGLDNAVETLKLNNVTGLPLLWHFIKPLFGFVCSAGFTVVFSREVIPIFEEMIEKNRLPLVAKVVDSIGQFFESTGLWLLFFGVTTLTAALTSLPLYTGRFREVLDDYPIFKEYRLLVSTAFLQSLSNMAKAKIGLEDSLRETSQVSPPFVAFHLSKMMGVIQTGNDNIGEILDTGLLLDEPVQVLKILGRTSKSEVILNSSSDIHREVLIKKVEKIKLYGAQIGMVINYSLMGLTLLALILSALTIRSNINIQY